MPKPKQIKTLSQLRDAILVATGGQSTTVAAQKTTIDSVETTGVSKHMSYAAEAWWKKGAWNNDVSVIVRAIGDTPADAYRNFCSKLKAEIEEQNRLRRLEKQEAQKAITHQPKRLEYQPIS